MNLVIHDKNGARLSEFEVGFPIVTNRKGSQAVHDIVVAYRAAQRLGTACTKTMGDVAGSGKKPWRQKGTGRARSGSFASPLWRGGGVVFGPKPRDFSKKTNRAARQLALRKALSDRLTAGDVLVVDELKIGSPKTKEVVKLLGALRLNGHILLVTAARDEALLLGARNLPGVELTTGELLNTYQVVRYDKLVFERTAFQQVEQRLHQ